MVPRTRCINIKGLELELETTQTTAASELQKRKGANDRADDLDQTLFKKHLELKDAGIAIKQLEDHTQELGEQHVQSNEAMDAEVGQTEVELAHAKLETKRLNRENSELEETLSDVQRMCKMVQRKMKT